MTMRSLKAHIEGDKKRLVQRDYEAWLYNQYTFSAIATALNSRKNKYVKEPFLKNYEIDSNQELSEEQLQKQRELFVAKLLAMQTNYEINHPKNNKKS